MAATMTKMAIMMTMTTMTNADDDIDDDNGFARADLSRITLKSVLVHPNVKSCLSVWKSI